VPLPSAFCWSKFGTEAGEPASSILSRKDAERREDGGIFLWGIGTSLRPSLLALLEVAAHPVVVFTPMRSPAASRDCAPEAVVSWHAAVGLDGIPYSLPSRAVVTSSQRARRRHYALVCFSEESLLDQPEEQWIDERNLRNLRTGTPVGSSQVTSVVRQLATRSDRPRYRVAFKAQLRAPYLVTLQEPALAQYAVGDRVAVAGLARRGERQLRLLA